MQLKYFSMNEFRAEVEKLVCSRCLTHCYYVTPKAVLVEKYHQGFPFFCNEAPCDYMIGVQHSGGCGGRMPGKAVSLDIWPFKLVRRKTGLEGPEEE
jgi:hypothetical protein